MPDSTPRDDSDKPRPAAKRKDFPLSIHKATGRWFKKLPDKRFVYFGKVADDPKGVAALERWLDQRDDLLAGRVPKAGRDELRIGDLCDHWLTYKAELVASGELAQRTHDYYRAGCKLLCESLGKGRSAADIGPHDFRKVRAVLSQRYGPVGLTNYIQVIRSLFKYGFDEGLLDKPARFGLFKKPRAKVIRESRLAKGDQDFTAAEVRALLGSASVNMRAMILLGVQAGFGNHDCATLTESAIDFKTGWLDWPRSKTATRRRFPLWAETLEAIRAAMASRPADSELVFMGRRGVDYIATNGGYRVAKEFSRAARDSGIASGRGFYCLRRSFQTQAEDARDLVAVQSIMGHIPSENDMSARYRQRVGDDRLQAVTDHVHGWLWPRPLVQIGGGQ